MRYFARLTNNKEYILLYTNLILSDSKKTAIAVYLRYIIYLQILPRYRFREFM